MKRARGRRASGVDGAAFQGVFHEEEGREHRLRQMYGQSMDKRGTWESEQIAGLFISRVFIYAGFDLKLRRRRRARSAGLVPCSARRVEDRIGGFLYHMAGS